MAYCPLMSRKGEPVDCVRQSCEWWREAGPGHPPGTGHCVISIVGAKIGALDDKLIELISALRGRL